MSFTETLQGLTGKPLVDCTNQELYLALLELVRQKSADRVQPVTGRKLYYISAEFLIGKLLSNNLINLGLYDEARDALAAVGKSLSDIEEVEPEPSLGNGGLGRLAACFLDSLATLNLPGDGVGLRYHFGLFHQSFENGVQNEKPDPWLTAHSWAEKTDITYPVELAGKEYTARLYKLAVTGYEGRTNTLNLFDLDTIDESIVHDGIAFDKTAIDKNRNHFHQLIQAFLTQMVLYFFHIEDTIFPVIHRYFGNPVIRHLLRMEKAAAFSCPGITHMPVSLRAGKIPVLIMIPDMHIHHIPVIGTDHSQIVKLPEIIHHTPFIASTQPALFWIFQLAFY